MKYSFKPWWLNWVSNWLLLKLSEKKMSQGISDLEYNNNNNNKRADIQIIQEPSGKVCVEILQFVSHLKQYAHIIQSLCAVHIFHSHICLGCD